MTATHSLPAAAAVWPHARGTAAAMDFTIDPSRHEKEELGAGASVTTRINCGKRPLGYVIFHDLVAFIQQHILFRLW
jgi:hypothetical protein